MKTIKKNSINKAKSSKPEHMDEIVSKQKIQHKVLKKMIEEIEKKNNKNQS